MNNFYSTSHISSNFKLFSMWILTKNLNLGEQQNVFMKYYVPSHMLVPKESSSQNMKVRKEFNSTQLKS